jgi:manganese transport protein
MLPTFIVVATGADPTEALVLSQVVLSIALPFPMVALLMFTGSADIMGRFANRGPTQAAAVAGAAIVLALNILLVLQTFDVQSSGLFG